MGERRGERGWVRMARMAAMVSERGSMGNGERAGKRNSVSV